MLNRIRSMEVFRQYTLQLATLSRIRSTELFQQQVTRLAYTTEGRRRTTR